MMTATAYCWTTASPAFARRPSPILCCAGISAMRFYQPTRSCMRTFLSSVHIAVPSAGRFLRPIPIGRNTVHRAAKRCTAGRKTRAQESAKRTIRTSKTPYFQGLLDAEPGHIKESYQSPLFRRSNCPQTKKKGCTYEKKISNRGRRNPAVHTDE